MNRPMGSPRIDLVRRDDLCSGGLKLVFSFRRVLCFDSVFTMAIFALLFYQFRSTAFRSRAIISVDKEVISLNSVSLIQWVF